MMIDFHTHLFPDDLAARAIGAITQHAAGTVSHTDGTRDGLLASMDRAGISHAVTLPIATRASQVRSINDFAARPHSHRIISFGTLYPGMAGLNEEIDHMRRSGIKGVKLHPEYQHFFADEKEHFPMYEALAAAGMICLFHAGRDPGPFTGDHSLPRSLKKIHLQFPSLRMVAAHMGGWQMWDEAEQEIMGLPLYLDTSATLKFLPPVRMVNMISRHGPERILFGTDSPWFDQAGEVEAVSRLPLGDAEKELILWRNAKELLGL